MLFLRFFFSPDLFVYLFLWNGKASGYRRFSSFPLFVSLFLCSSCNITLIISTVKRWVLIILWRFCERYEPCTFTWKALVQACLVKRAFSWKCIGRQPYSEGTLSRAVHSVCHYFTGIFHLLSHSIFLIWPHFYDNDLWFIPQQVWFPADSF